jgi:hypothetical protein
LQNIWSSFGRGHGHGIFILATYNQGKLTTNPNLCCFKSNCAIPNDIMTIHRQSFDVIWDVALCFEL